MGRAGPDSKQWVGHKAGCGGLMWGKTQSGRGEGDRVGLDSEQQGGGGGEQDCMWGGREGQDPECQGKRVGKGLEWWGGVVGNGARQGGATGLDMGLHPHPPCIILTGNSLV